MSILVTGATGQLGSAVARALADEGRTVRCVVRDKDRLGMLDPTGIQLVLGDVTDLGSMRTAAKGCKQVVHAAGIVSYLSKNRAWQEAVNHHGTRNILDAAAFADADRVLLTSSIAALGFVPDGQVGDEETAWNWGPYNLGYFETKFSAERLVLGDTRLEGVAVNPGITMGHSDTNHNGGRILLQVHQGGPFGVPTGATTVASLDDVVQGHLAALDRGISGERYVLGGHTPSWVELFQAAAQVVGVPPPTRVLPKWLIKIAGMGALLKGQFSDQEPPLTPALAEITAKNRRYSSAKAIRELGYEPKPLVHGLEQCWRWYLDNGHAS
jgi:dihydroflavonol-4-reductase